MGNPVAIGALLTQGIRNNFAMSYQSRYASVMSDINEVIAETTSDKISELYGAMQSALHPIRWPAETVIPSKGILSLQYRVQNRDFGRRVYLPRNYTDDQTGSVMSVARRLGYNWTFLPERLFFQYITNTTDNDLLMSIPTSADGNALYISTTRYGSANGNVVTQTGTATVQAIITDVFSIVRRFAEFQDTEGQPFWPADVVKREGINLFYGTSLTLAMVQAEKQALTALAASTATSNAGISNTIINSGFNIKFVPSQRITDASYYTFLRNQPEELRPLIRQVRKGMTEAQGNYATSDVSRDTGEEYVQFDSREGWGSFTAIGTIRASA